MARAQLSIHNSSMEIIGFINNDIPGALHYNEGYIQEFTQPGTATLSVTIQTHRHGKPLEQISMIEDNAYLSTVIDGRQYVFTILTMEENPVEKTLKITGEDLCMDLLNSTVGTYEASNPMLLSEYISAMDLIEDNNIELKHNHFTKKKLKLAFTSEETKLARLINVMNSFGAEFRFDTKLYPNGEVDVIELAIGHTRTVDKPDNGLGNNRDDIILRPNRDFTIGSRTVSKTELFNGVILKDPNGKVIKFKKRREQTIDVDGENRVEIYVDRNSSVVYAPMSMRLYPNQVKKNNCDNWTVRTMQCDYTSEDEQWEYARSLLNEHMYPATTYSVSVPGSVIKRFNLHTYDSFYLSEERPVWVRIGEIKRPLDDDDEYEVTLSTVVEVASKVTKSSTDVMNEMIKDAQPYRMAISSDNGVTLFSPEDITTITPILYKGNEIVDGVIFDYRVEDITYEGKKLAIEGSRIPEDGSLTITISAVKDDSELFRDTITLFRRTALQGEKGEKGDPGVGLVSTVTDYVVTSNGTDIPDKNWTQTFPDNVAPKQYIWSRTTLNFSDGTQAITYSVNYIGADGNSGKDGVPGKDGVGIKSTKIEYTASFSGLQPPTDGWGSDIPTLEEGQYLWTKHTWEYTDDTNEVGYSVSRNGVSQHTHVAYANSENGFTDFSLTEPNRDYIGICVDYDEKAPTDYRVYKWSRIKGDKGNPGEPGTDGRTPYVHFAYANSEDGKKDFSMSEGANRKYIGQYTDYTELDSPDPSKYTWVKVQNGTSTSSNLLLSDAEGWDDKVEVSYALAEDIHQGQTYTVTIDSEAGSEDDFIRMSIPGELTRDIQFDKGYDKFVGTFTLETKVPMGRFIKFAKPDGTPFAGKFITLGNGSSPITTWGPHWSAVVDDINKSQIVLKNYNEDYGFVRGMWLYSQDDSAPQNYEFVDYIYSVTGSTSAEKKLTLYSTLATELEKLRAGEPYTISFEAICTDGDNEMWTALREYKTSGEYVDRIESNKFKLSSEWKTYEFTTRGLIKSGEHYYWGLILGYNGIGTIQIRSVELTRSYQRVNAGMSQAEIAASITERATKSDVNNLAEQIASQQTRMEALEANAVAQDALDTFIEEYRNYISQQEENRQISEEEMSALASRVEQNVTDLANMAERWNFLDTYFKVANEGLVFGATDGSTAARISENRFSIYSEGKEVMFISSGVLFIENGIFSDTIQVGRFVESPYSDDNRDMNAIRWVGESLQNDGEFSFDSGESNTEDNPTEDNPTEDNPTEDNPTEDNPTEDNPTEDNPTEDNPLPKNLLSDSRTMSITDTTDNGTWSTAGNNKAYNDSNPDEYSTEIPTEGIVVLDPTGANNVPNGVTQTTKYVLKPGTYIFSVYTNIDANSNVYITTSGEDGKRYTHNASVVSDTTSDNKNHRLSWTFETYSDDSFFKLTIYGINKSGRIILYNPQLEAGSNATDFEPTD